MHKTWKDYSGENKIQSLKKGLRSIICASILLLIGFISSICSLILELNNGNILFIYDGSLDSRLIQTILLLVILAILLIRAKNILLIIRAGSIHIVKQRLFIVAYIFLVLLLLSLNILPLIFNGEYNYTPDEEIIGSLADLEIDMLITECRIKYTWMGTKKLKIIGISEDKNVEITSYESFIVSPLKVENYLMEMLKSFSHIDHTIIEEKRDNMSVIIYEYTGADAKQIITKTSRRVQLIEIYK